MKEALNLVRPTMTTADNDTLLREFDGDEIRQAVFQIHPSKLFARTL